MHEKLAGLRRPLRQLRDRGPRRLRIDVIRGDGRDPAPIIDPGRDQPRIDARREVRRRLDIHRRAQDQPRGGDAPKEIVQIRLRRASKLRTGLGAEVLDDHLLNVPETAVEIADGEERLEALGARLADADQNPSRERHAELAREPQRVETRLGRLVRRAIVDAARLAKPRAQRFEHDSLTDGHCPERLYLGAAHQSGVGVRQEAGLTQHKRAHRLEIADRGFISERIQRLARGAVAKLRLVAEGEQRLRAAGGRTGAGDGQHLVRSEIRGAPRARPLGEGAIVTDIPAKMGERNEHLARVGDVAPMGLVAQAPGGFGQLRERRLFEPNGKRAVARFAHRDHL